MAHLDGGDGKYQRIDNVTDGMLANYQSTFGSDLTKDDLFFYVYGILHSTEYRTRFAADLKKQLPRIPKVTGFRAFAAAGKKLAELHMNYESVEPFALVESKAPGASYRVEKMRYPKIDKTPDRSRISYNTGITLSGIPAEAHNYYLGSRSALDWVMERWRVTTDKDSGITNDPNDWIAAQGDDRYLVDLIRRVVTVSVETVKIVSGLPELDLVEPVVEAPVAVGT